jgi:hypothetical protein
MQRPARTLHALTALALATTLTACGDDAAPDRSTAAPPDAPAAWRLDAEPADALGVAEAKAGAQVGQPVVVRGRIGGRHQPIADDSPVFTIMDLGVKHCGQLGDDDHCSTPWDYCCELPETIAENAATVMLVDADGEPLDVSPTAQGLAPLDEVVLVGTVGPRPSSEVFTIRTTGVYRVE